MISNLVKRRDRRVQSTAVANFLASAAARRLAAIALASLSLYGCGSAFSPNPEGAVFGFSGGVVADEPRAAAIGRDVLRDGGTAADAVTATFFALGVTLPTSVGLGAGGLCVAYKAETNDLRVVDFLPRASAGGTVALPSAARGFAVLQAAHGRLRWSRLVQPAEALARFGTTVSRAFATEAAQGAPAALDGSEARELLTADGRPLGEGAPMTRLALSATLGRIRAGGAGDLYSGATAQAMVADPQGLLTAEELRGGTLPVLRAAVTLPVGDNVLALPPKPSAAGVAAAALYADLDATRYFRAKPEERPPLLLAAIAKALAAAGGESGPAAPGAGLVAVDKFGGSVACALTMGAKFGTGRTLGGTGVLLAPAPAANGAPGLSPLLIVNQVNNKTFEALVGTNGPSPVAAARSIAGPISIQVGSDTLVGGKSLQDAIERPRLSATDGGAVIESDAGDSARVLAEKGAKITAVEALGRVHAIFCPGGLPSSEPACDARADPRGAGLAAFGG